MLYGIANRLAPTTYLNQPDSDLQRTLCLNSTVLGADATGRPAYIEAECTRPLVNRMVEECVTSELRHHKQDSRPQAPKNSSNGRNVEHDGNWQDEEGDAACVVVGART